MYSLALTINTHGPLGASTYTVVRARLRLNTHGQPGIPTRPFSLCALPAPRQIHDVGRPSHVLPGGGAVWVSGVVACYWVGLGCWPRTRCRRRPSRARHRGRREWVSPVEERREFRYRDRRSRPSPGCARARQPLPPVRGAQARRPRPGLPGSARTADTRPSPTTVS